MATNITSTQLDFENIKSALKVYFEGPTNSPKAEFKDYNFEGAGLNNLLDVLAYNTHFNALIANFATNESFLNTAQLRSSVVSHAEALGYRPRSKVSSNASIKLNLNLSGASSFPSTITLPLGTTFTASNQTTSYTFKTRETYVATNDANIYKFKSAAGSEDVLVYQGTQKTKTFLIDSVKEDQIYVIPDENLDTSSVVVNVFPSVSSTTFETYTFLQKAIAVDATSTYFDIKESPNGYYEINFGDGTSFGKTPNAGSKVVVTYDSVDGENANGSTFYTPVSKLTLANGEEYDINVTSETESIGGSDKESLESIRKLAPIQFSAQQRLVTPLDYKGMIQSNFPLVTDVAVWGGQDNIPVDYGKVFISLKFPDGTLDSVKTTIKNQITTNFTKNLSIMSIGNEFVEPYETYLEISSEFYYNQGLTSKTLSELKTMVNAFIINYFTLNLNKFNNVFRRSAILTGIDDLDQAILSSKMDVKMQQRFLPALGSTNSYTINFPVTIASPSTNQSSIVSSQFSFNNEMSFFRNSFNRTNIEIVNVTTSAITASNIGSYNPSLGTVELTGFNPGAIQGGVNYIKVTAIPNDQSIVTPLRNYVITLDIGQLKVFGNIENDETKISLGTR